MREPWAQVNILDINRECRRKKYCVEFHSLIMHHFHCTYRDTSLVMDKLRIKYAPKLANAPLVLPDLMPDNKISDVLGSVNLETNLLELFCRGMLNPSEAEFSLKVCRKY